MYAERAKVGCPRDFFENFVFEDSKNSHADTLGEGEIISCLIENTETYFGGNLGHTIKQHHIIKNEAISGIVSCTTGPANQNRIILAATNSKLVHFIGPNSRDNVDGIFTGYTTGSNVISFEATSTFDSKLVLSPVDQKVRFKVFFGNSIKSNASQKDIKLPMAPTLFIFLRRVRLKGTILGGF